MADMISREPLRAGVVPLAAYPDVLRSYGTLRIVAPYGDPVDMGDASRAGRAANWRWSVPPVRRPRLSGKVADTGAAIDSRYAVRAVESFLAYRDSSRHFATDFGAAPGDYVVWPFYTPGRVLRIGRDNAGEAAMTIRGVTEPRYAVRLLHGAHPQVERGNEIPTGHVIMEIAARRMPHLHMDLVDMGEGMASASDEVVERTLAAYDLPGRGSPALRLRRNPFLNAVEWVAAHPDAGRLELESDGGHLALWVYMNADRAWSAHQRPEVRVSSLKTPGVVTSILPPSSGPRSAPDAAAMRELEEALTAGHREELLP